jgi:hypothetical protein
MPVIAIAVHKDNVLLATGGKWLIDGKSKPIQARIAKEQQSTKTTEKEAADEIRKRLPKGVHMKPLVKKDGYFTTKFIKLDDPNTPGFIKGTFPDKNYKNELPEAAIAREFEEETFTKIDESKFHWVANHVYTVQLTDAQAKAVIDNWKEKFTKEKTGELVNLEWVPITSVLAGTRKLNEESGNVIQHLLPPPPPGGGSRGSRAARVFSGDESKMATTRSMTRRKTRRAKSHCVGIKRSAVCKRTQGCKQAAGPKRRFCRTAKNRKH